MVLSVKISQYANVPAHLPTITVHSHRRFVCLLNVLGMESWLGASSPEEIAGELATAFQQLSYIAAGSEVTVEEGIMNETQLGPLIGWAVFSDSTLLYTPDDTWASFWVLAVGVQLLVSQFLKDGVPLRGAISIGEVAVSRSRSIFVGQPLADAHNYERKKVKGIGVRLTDSCLASLCPEDVPSAFQRGFAPPFWRKNLKTTDLLAWFDGCVYVNHWRTAILNFKTLAKGSSDKQIAAGEERLRECFYKRGLPPTARTDEILQEAMMFLQVIFEHTPAELDRRRRIEADFSEDPEAQSAEFARLNELGLRDD